MSTRLRRYNRCHAGAGLEQGYKATLSGLWKGLRRITRGNPRLRSVWKSKVRWGGNAAYRGLLKNGSPRRSPTATTRLAPPRLKPPAARASGLSQSRAARCGPARNTSPSSRSAPASQTTQTQAVCCGNSASYRSAAMARLRFNPSPPIGVVIFLSPGNTNASDFSAKNVAKPVIADAPQTARIRTSS
jgi:hypothetical protein